MKNDILFKKNNSYVLFDRETLNAIEIDKQTKLVYDKFNQKENLSKKEEKIIRLIMSNLSSTKKNTLPKPEIGSFRVILTEKCNLSCKNCFVKRNKVNLAEMSNKTLTSFIKKSLEKENSGEIKYHFFGGEPCPVE